MLRLLHSTISEGLSHQELTSMSLRSSGPCLLGAHPHVSWTWSAAPSLGAHTVVIASQTGDKVTLLWFGFGWMLPEGPDSELVPRMVLGGGGGTQWEVEPSQKALVIFFGA